MVADGEGGGQGTLITGLAFMPTRAQRQARPFDTLGWPANPGPWPGWDHYHVSVHNGLQKIQLV
ncbi:hypothetical protein [Streptomyces sp. H39-S7]|uniref:hypothetical protein n=1 Tax=Streptomyces sp. H39-S7 TaxID=3004357 RepID=UPI0022B00E16|nr:hypothetical protein [Streptomyces sp. H39-S7]MCZ4120265.1 hypothetical protein [Streptomyces sp. H39-S7]